MAIKFLFIMAFSALAEIACPNDVNNSILFIDACNAKNANKVVFIKNLKCMDKTHAEAVIDSYRNKGGNRYIVLWTTYYKTSNENRNAIMWEGYRYAIRCRIPVISYSGGGIGYDETEHNLINQFLAQGGIMYAAAGNNNKDLEVEPFYPAALDGVIAVGGYPCSSTGKWYSNYGKKVIFRSGCYKGYMEGSSFATPRLAAEEQK